MELQSKKQVWSLQEHSQTNEMQAIVSSVNVEKYIGGAECVDVCVWGRGGGERNVKLKIQLHGIYFSNTQNITFLTHSSLSFGFDLIGMFTAPVSPTGLL